MTKILIDENELENFIRASLTMEAYEAAGVDNWEGVDFVIFPEQYDVNNLLDSISSQNVSNLIIDNENFQKKYEFDKEPLTYEKLKFRMDLLKEEYYETTDAFRDGDSEEWVDGHIDMIVIALGNLYLAGIDIEKAWNEVFNANMSKIRGVKPGREQSGGFDVIKPEGWKAPSHKDNHGILEDIL